MLQISIRGVREVITKLGRFSSFLDNNRNFFEEEASQIVADEVKEVFDTGGFGSWPPLSLATLEQDPTRSPTDRLLRKTDRYYNAFTDINNPGNLRKVRGNTLEYGIDPNLFIQETGSFYPRFHEEGTRFIPQRSVTENIREPVLKTKLARAYRTHINRELTRLDSEL